MCRPSAASGSPLDFFCIDWCIRTATHPKQNIPPGTSFEDLPEDWRCPRCKRKKEKFVPVEE